MIAALLGVAWAAEPACERWSPDGFSAWTDRAQAAIDQEDVVGHGAVWRELQAALPCLDGPVPVDGWAELLAGLALVEHALGYAWQEPLATALQLRPDLRDQLPPPLAAFEPPAPIGVGTPLAGEVWIDGVRVTAEPPAGLHLAQRRIEGGWQTVLLRGAPLPADWRAPVPEPLPPTPPHAALSSARDRVVVTVGAGAASAAQRPSAANVHVPELAELGVGLAVATHGAWGGPVGVFWDAELPLRGFTEPDADVLAGARIALGPVEVNVGGGVSTARLAVEGAPQTLLLPVPHVGVGARPAVGPGVLDLRVGGGLTPAAASALARAGFQWARPAAPWLGVVAQIHRGAAAEVDGPLSLDASRWTLSLHAGVALGRRS